MLLFFGCTTKPISQISALFSIILLTCCVLIYAIFQSCDLSFSNHLILPKLMDVCLESNSTYNKSQLSLNNLLSDLIFSTNRVYHHNGVAYDFYSKDELGQTTTACQWKTWPMNQTLTNSTQISPHIISKLPFVDAIYVMTDPRLTERHQNLKKAFQQQGISTESVEWRLKWNQTTCNSDESRSHVYQRLNLKDKPLNLHDQRRCALAMKHADVWYEMSEQKISLGLILEDDAIFVPFFKEKFTRMIHTALETGVLRVNGTCIKPRIFSISNNEIKRQNPIIVIGICLSLYSKSFQRHLSNARPLLSTQKSNPSRCSHAYLLTSCSAQALVHQIHQQKNDFLPLDHLKNKLVRSSSTIQSFWMDPPLSYQGNQVIDLDNINTFTIKTYE